MNEDNPLTHYSVTIQFVDHPGHFEPEVLAKSPKNAARIALWRLKPEFRRTTVALIISAPPNSPTYFPAYDGQPLTFVRDERRRTLLSSPPSAPGESRNSRQRTLQLLETGGQP
jgi:hypothetical protein